MTGTAGVLYFGLTFAAAVLRTTLLLVYGRLRLPPEPAGEQPSAEQHAAPAAARLKGAWNSVRERLPGRLLRIGIYVVPIYTAVFVLNHLGLFRLTQDWLADVVVDAFIPMEALSVVVLSFVAEFTSGFAAAGAFMTAGILNVKQTVLALLSRQRSGVSDPRLAPSTAALHGNLLAADGGRTVAPGAAVACDQHHRRGSGVLRRRVKSVYE